MPRAFFKNGAWYKKCAYKECGAVKPIEEFGKMRGASDGRYCYCSRCARFRCAEYRRRHREKCLRNLAKWRRANRETIRVKARERYWKMKVDGTYPLYKKCPLVAARARARWKLTAKSLACRLAVSFKTKKMSAHKINKWLQASKEFHRLFDRWAKDKHGNLRQYSKRCPFRKPSLIRTANGFRITTIKEVRKAHQYRAIRVKGCFAKGWKLER